MSELDLHLARKGRPYSFGHQQMYRGPIELLKGRQWDVLDVGAGIGFGYHEMVKADILGSYTGLEPHPKTFEFLKNRKHKPHHHFIQTDLLGWGGLENGPVDRDYVFCIEVIEHVDPKMVPAFLAALYVCTGKALFLSTPDSSRHKHGVRTDQEWEWLLREAGFKVVSLMPQWTTLHVCTPV